jgi:urease accessory protein
MRRPALFLASLTLLGISPVAFAHPGHLGESGFATGLLHPFTGFDHLLAMIAVGLWAGQRGGRTLYAAPASFLVMMTMGALSGAGGLSLPLVEPGILGSLVVFGLLIAFNARLSMAAGIAVVGSFALFHGYAHAVEMPAHASLVRFGSGLLFATLLLHVTGIALGRLSQTHFYSTGLRYSGGAIAAVGVGLLLGA